MQLLGETPYMQILFCYMNCQTYVAEAASAVADAEELAVLHAVLAVASLHGDLLFILASSGHREPVLKHHIVQLCLRSLLTLLLLQTTKAQESSWVNLG